MFSSIHCRPLPTFLMEILTPIAKIRINLGHFRENAWQIFTCRGAEQNQTSFLYSLFVATRSARQHVEFFPPILVEQTCSLQRGIPTHHCSMRWCSHMSVVPDRDFRVPKSPAWSASQNSYKTPCKVCGSNSTAPTGRPLKQHPTLSEFLQVIRRGTLHFSCQRAGSRSQVRTVPETSNLHTL